MPVRIPPTRRRYRRPSRGDASAVWGDHGAPRQGAVAHALVGVLDALEWEMLGVSADVSRAGELEDLGEFDRAAPVGMAEARVGGQRGELVAQRAAGAA